MLSVLPAPVPAVSRGVYCLLSLAFHFSVRTQNLDEELFFRYLEWSASSLKSFCKMEGKRSRRVSAGSQ